MTLVCPSPDPSLGVAQRLATYLDCHGRALGENGYQLLANGPLGAAILAAALTLFVAIVGYRLIFGQVPDVRDGAGWLLRLGFVLALVTSWPAFQTLVYRVAVDGPQQIGSLYLAAARLPSEQTDARVQRSYDLLRVGLLTPQAPAAERTTDEASSDTDGVPKTATLLVISTVGIEGTLKIAIGLLLALSPLAFISLLFSGSAGLFSGWLRSLAGLVLGLVGATVVTATNLLVLEGEIVRQQLSAISDPQALTTIVTLFALMALGATVAGMWMASALALPTVPGRLFAFAEQRGTADRAHAAQTVVMERAEQSSVVPDAPARATMVARALSASVYREQQLTAVHDGPDGQPGAPRQAQLGAARTSGGATVQPLGATGRRSLARRTNSAARRDRMA